MCPTIILTIYPSPRPVTMALAKTSELYGANIEICRDTIDTEGLAGILEKIKMDGWMVPMWVLLSGANEGPAFWCQ